MDTLFSLNTIVLAGLMGMSSMPRTLAMEAPLDEWLTTEYEQPSWADQVDAAEAKEAKTRKTLSGIEQRMCDAYQWHIGERRYNVRKRYRFISKPPEFKNIESENSASTNDILTATLQNDFESVISLLQNAHTWINETDVYGNTFLHFLLLINNSEHYLKLQMLVTAIIEHVHNIDFSKRNHKNQTLLQLATGTAQYEMVLALLQHPAIKQEFYATKHQLFELSENCFEYCKAEPSLTKRDRILDLSAYATISVFFEAYPEESHGSY